MWTEFRSISALLKAFLHLHLHFPAPGKAPLTSLSEISMPDPPLLFGKSRTDHNTGESPVLFSNSVGILLHPTVLVVARIVRWGLQFLVSSEKTCKLTEVLNSQSPAWKSDAQPTEHPMCSVLQVYPSSLAKILFYLCPRPQVHWYLQLLSR